MAIQGRSYLRLAAIGVAAQITSTPATFVGSASVGSGQTPSGAASAGVSMVGGSAAAGSGQANTGAVTAASTMVGASSCGSGQAVHAPGFGGALGYRAILDAALAAKTLTWVAIGDSITEGQETSTLTNRWIDKAVGSVRTRGFQPAGVTGAVTGFLPGWHGILPAVNPYTSRSGSATDLSAAGVSPHVTDLGASGSVTYTVTGTDADIHWTGGGGTFTWSVDGGGTTS